jgi:hypothetical protein
LAFVLPGLLTGAGAGATERVTGAGEETGAGAFGGAGEIGTFGLLSAFDGLEVAGLRATLGSGDGAGDELPLTVPPYLIRSHKLYHVQLTLILQQLS